MVKPNNKFEIFPSFVKNLAKKNKINCFKVKIIHSVLLNQVPLSNEVLNLE